MAGWDGRGSWLTFDPLITGGVQALASNVGTVQPSGGLGRTRQSGPLTMRSITPPLRWSRISAESAPPSTGKNPVVSASTSAHTLLRSEEHTSELQSLMRISYADFCLKKK